jgi:tetratricopeptide (TPR) repeat protein
MAKKRPRPQGKPAKSTEGRRTSPPRKSSRHRQMPSPFESIFRKLSDGPDDLEESSPRSAAERLLHQAYESDDAEEIANCAMKALVLWPDCADAYSLLAEQAGSPKEAMELYKEAIAAAERDLGPEFLERHVGHFWGLLETRPYMRARNDLANALWVLGRREEAIQHYRAMLVLNPGDNQGIRYVLATALLDEGLDDELAELLARYEDDASAYWVYSAALLAFRREGDSPRAREMLARATSYNPHVPGFLTGRENIGHELPDTYEKGKESEAAIYAQAALRGWRSSPGGLDWIRRATPKAPSAKKRGRAPKARSAPKGPTPLVKKRLACLPQGGDVWQADIRPLPLWLNVADSPVRPWTILVVSRSEDLILAQELVEEPPSMEAIWSQLVKAMEKPAMGEPHRPSEIQVRPADHWDDLEPDLDDLSIQRTVFEELDLMDKVVEHLATHLRGGAPAERGLLDMPGVRPDQVASFFQAAAAYYRQAPWRGVSGEETIRIDCDRFESGPWFAVVIGQMGMTPGLAIYEDFNVLIRMRSEGTTDDENARESVAMTVTFGEQVEMPFSDLDAAAKHGWEIAAPEAHPWVMRKERGMSMRPLLAWELQLMEAALKLVPVFLAERDLDNTEPLARDVPTGGGPLTLSLRWWS